MSGLPAAPGPWLPVSPCGSSCLPVDDPGAQPLRRLSRLLGLGAVLMVSVCAGPVTVLLGRRTRHRCWRGLARAGLAVLGLRLEVIDHRPRGAGGDRGVLVAANHISYLDIAAVAAVLPARFVAKHELPATAVLRCFGVLRHRRGRLHALRADVDRTAQLLRRGRTVAVFPEGTTRCGRAAGRCHPAFFQAALDAGVPVQPVSLRYHRHGQLATAPGYLGEDGLGDTLRRVMGMRGLTVTVTVHAPVPAIGERRELAARCARLIGSPPPQDRHWSPRPARGYPGRRSCPSTSTTPPPPRWSPLPSRR
ncbi:1-acylglycerol-3-phosphate O-acyltransferase [Gordonia hirsuta DSM 44140 = NBRC 16056]|uniref:1-acylglycerol-3-phosphate O-acyltransferase n=1 Tax=Gordonia hirsuta DSM 44140 = NBRC 16056 TaxID=1121927 RepID=L7L5F1_9ACTN|nr:lysophospholipid acyltransferase family protein [Gordonia hirsuta]GAC56169.1 1-acylglycerol-3-phosphate O-acyltransferase [Gordonia hirsuta DSM 44140 = NBRC 16056]